MHGYVFVCWGLLAQSMSFFLAGTAGVCRSKLPVGDWTAVRGVPAAALCDGAAPGGVPILRGGGD